jgi:hypothetical protein
MRLVRIEGIACDLGAWGLVGFVAAAGRGGSGRVQLYFEGESNMRGWHGGRRSCWLTKNLEDLKGSALDRFMKSGMR